MMEEEEVVMGGAQMEDAVLLLAEDHLHAVLMEGHQTEDHPPAVQMAGHQVGGAVLQGQEAADHLHQAMVEAATADLKALHQKEEVVPQAADVDVKKVVLPTDRFHKIMPTEK